VATTLRPGNDPLERLNRLSGPWRIEVPLLNVADCRHTPRTFRHPPGFPLESRLSWRESETPDGSERVWPGLLPARDTPTPGPGLKPDKGL